MATAVGAAFHDATLLCRRDGFPALATARVRRVVLRHVVRVVAGGPERLNRLVTLQRSEIEKTRRVTCGRVAGAGAPTDIFNRPTDVAWDTTGNTYVADGVGNQRVAKFDKNGVFIKSWGSRGTEPGQFGSKLWESIQPSFGGAELVCNILPLHIAKFTHSVLEFLFE